MSVRISVIMPVYNAEEYLPAAIESVRGQTLRDIELILVDDGSTDGSPAVCDRHHAADPRVKVIHKANAGVAAARNDGLDVATGEYLMFCDADDEYTPGFCARMLEEIVRTGADVVVCGSEFIREEGYLGASVRADDSYYNPRQTGVIELHPYDRLDRINVLLWNKIFRMDAVRCNGIRFPVSHEHDDDAFWFQYMMVSRRASLIDDRLYRYRLRAGSIMDLCVVRKTPRNRLDWLATARYVADFARRNGLVAGQRAFLLELCRTYYRLGKDCFSAEELASQRVELIREFSDCFTPAMRLLEVGDDLDVSDREPAAADGPRAFWYWLRAGLSFSKRGRRRLLYKARWHWAISKVRRTGNHSHEDT